MTTTANTSSSSSSSSSSEIATVKLNLPPSLVFLISNIHSFVTIKLDSHNYVIWRTQIEHALKANNFFGYVDGSIQCPSSTAVRTTDVSISDPDFVLWKVIDSQLLSCLIATISATTLPLILGLEHASQVWEILEQRFNSVSRTHIHDLKRQLYNVTKTSTLEAYFDLIKQLSYKLAAAGSPVTDEDLIFYALHGLPTEFDSLQTAISTRAGDITFEELITLANGEEMRKHRSALGKSADGTSSVFLAVPKSNAQPGVSNMYSASHHVNVSAPHNVSQQHNGSEFYPMVSQQQPPMFTASLPQSSNRNWNNGSSSNRSRGYKNQKGENACQICNKTNHTARTCYHRSNLNYQPPTYSHYSNTTPQQRPFYSNTTPQAHMLQTSYSPTPYSPTSSGLLPLPTNYLPPINTIPYPSTYSTTTYPPSPTPNPISCPSPYSVTPPSYPVSSAPPSNWYLDSGATNHVTNDFSNLSLQHSTSAPAGVVVGNGQTVPIAHSGHSNQPDTSTWSFSSGALSNSGLF